MSVADPYQVKIKSFTFKEVYKGWSTVLMGNKKMPIDQTADLIDVVLHAILTNAKLSNLDQTNVLKVVYSDGDIFACLDLSLEDCINCESNLSRFDNFILITIRTYLSTTIGPTKMNSPQ